MTQPGHEAAPAVKAEAEAPPRGTGALILRVALGVAAVVALVLVGREAGGYIPVFRGWVADLGPWGPIAFVLGYAAAVIGFVPGAALTLAAGAIFGVATGTVYVFIAALLGSGGAFLVSRYFARAAVERRISGNARFGAIDRAVEQQGRKIVFLLRLSPAFPFSLMNYGLGLTRVRFADYMLAGFGMLPGTLVYVYLGAVGGEAAAAVGGADVGRSPAEWALLVVGLAATIAVTWFVTRIARRALSEATDE